MKTIKSILLILILLFCLLKLVACGSPVDVKDTTGRVVNIRTNGYFLVEFPITNSRHELSNTYWFYSNQADTLKIGQIVRLR
jgi:hypothetical protein